MAEPKPLTYDEQKAAEAAFVGAPSNPKWTEAAQLLYVRLSATIQTRSKETIATSIGGVTHDGTRSHR